MQYKANRSLQKGSNTFSGIPAIIVSEGMSLSDYSSDNSLDEEPAVGVEVLKSVARSSKTGGPSSMDSSSKSMVKVNFFT